MKNSYTMAGLLLALALSGSVLAAQTSSSPTQTAPPSATSGAPSQTTSPSATGTPSQASPAGEAGAQSGTQATPQDRGAAGAQGAQSAGHPGSVEDELQLTADQKAKLQPIIQDEMAQIDAVRSDTTMSMDQKQAKVQQIKQTSFPKIQAVLTPEQQKKLSELQQRAREQQQGAAGQSASPSNSQTPPKQ